MGFFSKGTKANPVIETEGVRIEYDPEIECWQFSHKSNDFVAYATALVLPTQEQLASILADIIKLRPEMAQRMAKGCTVSKGVRTNDGETYLVNVTDFCAQGTFVVSWSGGKSWGDMGVDFTITNHEIADESWGD